MRSMKLSSFGVLITLCVLACLVFLSPTFPLFGLKSFGK
jgi:hypothetical protein